MGPCCDAGHDRREEGGNTPPAWPDPRRATLRGQEGRLLFLAYAPDGRTEEGHQCARRPQSQLELDVGQDDAHALDPPGPEGTPVCDLDRVGQGPGQPVGEEGQQLTGVHFGRRYPRERERRATVP